MRNNTLDEWSQLFDNHFGERDKNRSYSEMWLLSVEHASNVAEAVREQNYVNAYHGLAEVFCWTSGFIKKCNKEKKPSPFHFSESFNHIVYLKYPDICPLCGSNRCECPNKQRDINKMSPEEKENKYKIAENTGNEKINDSINVSDIDKLVEMFSNIYGNSYVLMNLEDICFHFTEEIGEVAEMVRKLDRIKSENTNLEGDEIDDLQMQLKKELADVFSWTCALIIKLNILIKIISSVASKYSKTPEIPKIKFSHILQDFYETCVESKDQSME